MGVVFDKLEFMRRLEGDATFTRPQAETLTDAFYVAVTESVATKQDVAEVRTELRDTRSELKHEIQEVRSELKHEIAELRSELKHEMTELRSEVKHEIAGLRSEVRHEIAGVRSEIGLLRSDMKAETAQLKVWAAGTGVAIISAMSALKLFH